MNPLRLTALADRRMSARPPVRPTLRLSIEERFDALDNGEWADWRLLDWLHVLRHKQRWDICNRDRADHTAEQIWRAAQRNPDLLTQVLGQLVNGLCGGPELAPSMIAALRRTHPLRDRDPLLQEIIDALTVVDTDPGQLIALCMRHHRSPRVLLTRAGLPGDLPLLRKAEAAIPEVIQVHARNPESARTAAQWLLMSLRDAALEMQDRVAEGLLTRLSAAEAQALPDLCWWLSEMYGPQAPGSRGRALSKGAHATLASWL